MAVCMLSTNDKGVLGAADEADAWTFTPNLANDATVKVPDADYAYFGWWLKKPEKNTETHNVEVFAGGTNEVCSGRYDRGNREVCGSAAGKYATKTFTAGAQTDAGVGHFTANSNLTAKFGKADGSDVGTLGGSITGFELDDGSTPGWTVKLETVDLTIAATFTGTTEVNFGGGLTDTEAGDVDQIWHWQGAFYGAGADDADDDDAPDAVAGTFDAVTENAAVIGGFGATKQ